jgi:hypothetical protein
MGIQSSEPLSTSMQFQSFSEDMRQVTNPTQYSTSNYEYHNAGISNNEALSGQIDNMLYNNIIDGTLGTSGTNGITAMSHTSPEYNLFLDDYHMPNFYLPAALFDSDLPTSLWSQPDWNSSIGFQSHRRAKSGSRACATSIFTTHRTAMENNWPGLSGNSAEDCRVSIGAPGRLPSTIPACLVTIPRGLRERLSSTPSIPPHPNLYRD